MINYRNIWIKADRKRRRWEVFFKTAFNILLNKQVKELAARITEDNYQSIENIDIDTKPLENLFYQLYIKVGKSFARDSYSGRKASEELIEDRWEAYMKQYAKTLAAKKITSISATTIEQARKIIQSILDRTIEEGLGSMETARLIRNALTEEMIPMNTWRALRIARTEVVSASNVGSLAGAKSLDMPMDKVWIATADGRTRDDHMALNGTEIGINEKFDVGGEYLECPGDPDGSPEQVINCRCTLAYSVKKL